MLSGVGLGRVTGRESGCGFFGGLHEAGTVRVGGVWCRSYVENYTVDASILDRSDRSQFFWVVVVMSRSQF